tara:strand:+ start:281 stop:1516 length:1236 start_codon:yes stop_codon:yes gene_type:complete
MKIHGKNTVLVEAEKRIRRLFDSFENVVVGFSGGKDSTVCLNLTLKIAEERGRLPLKVLWVDQEAEWQGTADYCQSVFNDERVEPWWFQIPMKWYNNVSSYDKYIYIWQEGVEHIRELSPISIKENKYLDFGFHEVFEKIFKVHFPNQKSCYISGVRTEESPKRFVSLTSEPTYEDITWGKQLNKSLGHYTFYPLYDWSYTDIWKYIHDNDCDYNKVYDGMYNHGVPLKDMRISNLHHETAIQSLMIVQEIEPETWNRVSKRIEGANTIKHLAKNSFVCPKELPSMFDCWKDYALHLAENIIQEENIKKVVFKKIKQYEDLYSSELISEKFWRTIINTILSSDWDFTKLSNWLIAGGVQTYRRVKRNPNGENKKNFVWIRGMLAATNYLTIEEKQKLVKYFENERTNTKSA